MGRVSALVFISTLLLLTGAASSPRAEASGQLTLTPGAVNFGNVWVGRTHTISVTVTNTGNATVTLSGDTLTGSGYSVKGITVPSNLRAGATTTFSVQFTPPGVGVYSGKVQLTSNAANGTLMVQLSGTGISRGAGYVSATPLTAQFGSVPVGTRNTQSVQLHNTGTRSVTIASVTATGGGFSVSGISTPLSIAAGATAQLTVAFLPASAGSISGTVAVACNASDSQLSIAVSGTGVAVTRILSVSPTSVTFGNVSVNSTAVQQLTLTNSGNSILAIAGESVSGAGVTATGLGGSTTLAPGQIAVLTAGFSPQTAGTVAGSIAITSNATNGVSMSVPVSGTGMAAASHAVGLQWTPSSSSGVSGYYVYRAGISGGPYAKMTGSAISGTSYTDNSVSAGATYYYAVTALGSDGLESPYSSPAAATIP